MMVLETTAFTCAVKPQELFDSFSFFLIFETVFFGAPWGAGYPKHVSSGAAGPPRSTENVSPLWPGLGSVPLGSLRVAGDMTQILLFNEHGDECVNNEMNLKGLK